MQKAADRKLLTVNVCIFIVLCALVTVLNYSTLSGGLRWDDSTHLFHVQSFSIVDDFITPEIWQQFSPANLTPWLPLSYETDLVLFGLNFSFYYIHQFVALAAVAYALYHLLTCWVARKFAFFGSCLFLMGAPVFVVAQQLMTRHYVEGLLFCLLSLIFFVLSLRENRWYLILASAIFYLASVTAKEVYVPLVLLLVLIPESNARTRIITAIPHIAIAILYALWRAYMLEDVSGGYVDSSDYFSIAGISGILASFLTFPELLFGGYWPVYVLILAIIAGIYTTNTKKDVLFSLSVLVLILAPMAPLVSFPGIVMADRYLLLMWTALCFATAFYSDFTFTFLRGYKVRHLEYGVYAACIVFLAVSLLSGLNVRTPVANVAREFDAQGNFMWENDDRFAFTPSENLLGSFWFVTGLNDLKFQLTNGNTSPIAVVDSIYLNPGISKLWSYDSGCYCMRESDESIAELTRMHESRVNEAAPLQLYFEYVDGYFSWEFGPYDSGQYHVVSNEVGVIPAPKSGRLRVNLDEGTQIYLRYTSPEGWLTYSELQSVHKNAPPTRWQRELN